MKLSSIQPAPPPLGPPNRKTPNEPISPPNQNQIQPLTPSGSEPTSQPSPNPPPLVETGDFPQSQPPSRFPYNERCP
jgi:hypothetical protein